MHMLELHGGPEHLVVFITSDQDFCEKIQELQRRNFKVVVLYHGPSASQKPVSITSVADESHDWLTFLKRELGFSHLTLAPYDPTAYHGASQGYNSGMTPPPPSATRQPSQESRTPSKACTKANCSKEKKRKRKEKEKKRPIAVYMNQQPFLSCVWCRFACEQDNHLKPVSYTIAWHAVRLEAALSVSCTTLARRKIGQAQQVQATHSLQNLFVVSLSN